eukprot:gnl/TRDRNA2_/TRDRNA2_94835_c0_seq1.p2 gnl/TRDRNA2_/TRDRNA2_94835_c0~~gnl/TRDRNA2_/TRDRNA2_94835_c0_seq1.p2  ORF type:complete len:148 (+),score=3.72 gnl/TRDRNA2_/TRDRNA2_94835_c0_seq1:479-922(+)
MQVDVVSAMRTRAVTVARGESRDVQSRSRSASRSSRLSFGDSSEAYNDAGPSFRVMDNVTGVSPQSAGSVWREPFTVGHARSDNNCSAWRDSADPRRGSPAPRSRVQLSGGTDTNRLHGVGFDPPRRHQPSSEYLPAQMWQIRGNEL